ncbi:hypothetical protein BJY04DRAFT_182877 [Aspergillus karnatakaensis]|uniref:uncharacterized protein n=1 Tax=Aspergillus karnatakaensis TaxID=1810916 RepID=UPI003CCD7C9D
MRRRKSGCSGSWVDYGGFRYISRVGERPKARRRYNATKRSREQSRDRTKRSSEAAVIEG